MSIQRSDYIWSGSLAFVVGVMAAKYHQPSQSLYLAVPALLALVTLRGRVGLISVIMICLLVGFWRTSFWDHSLQTLDNMNGQTVNILGRVVTDQVYDDRRQAQFEVADITINGLKIKGKLRVKAYGVAVILRGDEVTVTGKLRPGYASWQGSISYAEVELVRRSPGMIDSVRRKFASGVFSRLSDIQASLALGILVGQRTNIDEDTDDLLRKVGLTHIIAVSGYNLSVIVRLIRRRLKWLPRRLIFLLASSFALLFVGVAGNSASIVRAAWVVGISLTAWYYGKVARPISLLMLSAAATVWFDVYYVWFDLGWWLSFLAFYGVLMIGPALSERFFGSNKPGFLAETAIESFSASLMTLPLIAWIFGRVSMVSLAANTLVVPLIPAAMVSVAGLGAVGYLLPDTLLTSLIAVVAALLLNLILALSEAVSSTPLAEASVDIDVYQAIYLYVLIVLASYLLNRGVVAKRRYDLLE